ncbi:MAG TPA: biosynthetic peptidoglycan transglycosylase [Niastella sp.]
MIRNLLFILFTGLFKRIPGIAAAHKRSKQLLSDNYKKHLDFRFIRITGFNSLQFSSFSFCDEVKGISISAKSIKLKIRFTGLIQRTNLISCIEMADGEIKMSLQQSPPSSGKNQSDMSGNIERICKRAIHQLLNITDKLPHRLHLSQVNIFQGLTEKRGLYLSDFTLNSPSFKIDGTIKNGSSAHQFIADGILKKEKYGKFNSKVLLKTDIKIYPGKQQDVFPLQVSGVLEQQNEDLINYSMDCFGTNLLLNGEPVIHSSSGSSGLQISLNGCLKGCGFFINNTSFYKFNYLSGTFSWRHTFGEQPNVEIGFQLSRCKMDDILNSFPGIYSKGLFTSTFSGTFAIDSTLKIALKHPFKYSFDLSIDKDLCVVDPGTFDLHYLKQAFTHTFYNNEKPFAELSLSESNPNFLPLDKISDYLKKVLVFTEDRHFYSHKGIDFDGLELAIVTNLANRKISRGGSTITMQLMRNLFLHHRRTAGRKLEEIILAWLVEEYYKINKDRLLEIYLNIIEFGPGIYGIGHAADFYFGKHAEDLSVSESLVISYMVPRPIHFYNAVKSGSAILVENLRKHFHAVSAEMVQKGLISKDELQQIQYEPTIDQLFSRVL